jgi:hypothetical protein
MKGMKELRQFYWYGFGLLFPEQAARNRIRRAIRERSQSMQEKVENGEPLSESDRQLGRLFVAGSKKRSDQ